MKSKEGIMPLHASSDPQSDLYPAVGELWDCEDRIAIICGNSISEQGKIWVMEWDTGRRGDAKVAALILREDRKSLTEHDI